MINNVVFIYYFRLYAANEEDRIGRSGNVPPGTTVDTKITHPSDKDFYMVSHEVSWMSGFHIKITH